MTQRERAFDRRGYVVLTLGFGDVRDVTGYGLEIVDTGGGQNEAARMGRIYYALGQDAPDPFRPAEPFTQTSVGNRDLIHFDRIMYTHPTLGYPLGSNPIKVKVFTQPKVAWTDTEPAGLPRVRHLERSPVGGVVLAANGSAGDAVTVYRNDGQVEDRFWQDSQFDDRMYWYGIISGTRSFDAYVETKSNAFDPHRQWVQRMVATDYTGGIAARMAAFQPGPEATFTMDFNVGINALTRSNTSFRIPVPAGIFALHVLNTDALGTNTLRFLVGVIGHT